MPRYLLHEDIALRSYETIPFCYYRKGACKPCIISREEFSALLSCDGTDVLPEDDTVRSLLERGIIREKVSEDEALLPWQYYHYCSSDFAFGLTLEITQRCNCNCLHCFNATGNEVPKEELSLNQILQILDEAYECGIFFITLTGGEPLLHRDFTAITDAISERGIELTELNTNGSFLTEELLDRFRQKGYDPLIKISYDGIGFHDEMRGRAGMEDAALSAIRLAVQKGFRVMVQMNVNHRNESVILPSLSMLDDMQVYETRLIRTVETPRWKMLHKGESLDWEEFYHRSLELLQTYCSEDHAMNIWVWSLLKASPLDRTYQESFAKFREGGFKGCAAVCSSSRTIPAIGANGRLYPCLQASGYFDAHGIFLGSVHENSLDDLLKGPDYQRMICMTLDERAERHPECGSCEYFQICGGGCPAMGLLYSGAYGAADPTKCLIFKRGIHQKIKKLFADLGYQKLSL